MQFLADAALLRGGDFQDLLLQAFAVGDVLSGAEDLGRIAILVAYEDGVAAIEPAPFAVGVPDAILGFDDGAVILRLSFAGTVLARCLY